MGKDGVYAICQKYLIPTYRRIGPVFVRGRGSCLWDKDGNKYLDLFPGWGVSILGHCHPRIIDVISRQAKELIHLPNNLYHPYQAKLAQIVVRHAFPGKVFFANSGAEAVEGAIKFSRLYGKGKRYEIIVMKNSFHGRTFAALSATGQKKYKLPFKPLLPSFREVEFNNFSYFKRNLNKKTVGVLIEFIQGEGGVNVAEAEFVNKISEFCHKNDILFMVDEIQTGMARTGKMFCFQHYGVKPDVMMLSKGLGAGFPISLFMVRKDLADLMQPGHHASTFGGNPLACRVAIEVFNIIKEENILAKVRTESRYLFRRLFSLRNRYNSIIKEVRGKGLMVGLELKMDASSIFQKALKKRLIVNATHGNVLRIMPALNVKREELDKGMDILEGIFRYHNK